MEALRRLRPEIEKCFRCSLCKMVPLPVVKDPRFTDACPAARFYGFHGYSASGKQIMALALLDGRITPDEQTARTVFACTSCGYGDVACKFIMPAERQQVNLALKAFLVKQGLARPEHHQLANCLRRHGHTRWPLPQPAGSWAQGLDLKVLPPEKADILLFAGCLTCADAGAAAVTRKLARLLQQAGVDFGILGEAEDSCGLPAYWTGHNDAFAAIAERTTRTIRQTGARTVITVSGSCFGALHAKYPEYIKMDAFQVRHAAQVLLELVTAGRLKLTRPVNLTVTYHDPCYLGRQSEPPVVWQGEEKRALNCMAWADPPRPLNYGTDGVYDPPRQLLLKIPGLTFNEMYRIREYAFCCGGGGGAPEAYPDFAAATTRHRLEEARSVGAEVMVTACHHCRARFQQARTDRVAASMPVSDIIDLVFQAAGLTE